jgi:hypothetical protein
MFTRAQAIASLASLAISGCVSREREIPQSTAPAVANPREAKALRFTFPKGDFTIEFSNLQAGDPDAEPPTPGQAWVRIIKEDPVAGAVEWSKIHTAGWRIGGSIEDGVPASNHKVLSAKDQRGVPVDFDTKAVLAKVTVGKLVPHVSRHCPRRKEDPLAKCPGPENVKSFYKVNEVVITLESGANETLQEPSGRGPAPDGLCTSHGGKVDPPKWREEELKAVRTLEAENLLFGAEDGWRSKNPKVRKRSQDSYRRLLKEFPAESVVTRNIDRIKARAEAVIEE